LSFFKNIFSGKPKTYTDAELLALYRQHGNMADLGLLYDRHIHKVYGTSLKYLKNEDNSKDIVMAVFEKIAIKLKTIEVQQFEGWLYMVTKNECLQWLRKQKGQKEISFEDIGLKREYNGEEDMEKDSFLYQLREDFESADLTDDLENDLVLLEKAILLLPNEQKQCIELFYLQGKCYKEIVDLTGFELSKVKSYIQNGKRNLKNHLSHV
jgi:RNA polymerase sigma factor (sigma-70 family)